MDTDSKNSDNPRSWSELVSQAINSDPPSDFDILSSVRRAVAAEPVVVTSELAAEPAGWLEELTDLLDSAWLKPALAAIAVGALLICWQAVGAWSEMTFALDLQLPMLTNLL